jgi:transposase InsO family protein
MMDNTSVQSFTHHGNKSGTGTISFQDTKGHNIATITMSRRRDGLWFTDNAVLIPPNLKINKVQIKQPICPEIGSDIQPILHQLAAPTHFSTAMKNLELWHQRMGHPSNRTLRRTQRVIDGIPRLPDAEAIFSCPFCDKAKLRKHHGKGPSTRETFLPGTSFHMDIGFIRGPKNLKEVINNGATPKETIIASHDGYTCYLLIIDSATRYVWTFLLKERSPPISLLKQFLTKHGYPKQANTITTSPTGLLAKSLSFNKVCNDQGFTVKQSQVTIDWEAIDVQPNCTIRTDNEYAVSDAFRQAVRDEHFVLETTAPDTSHQNGMGKRPHRTLKERVRCLLYTAAFGLEFWSDGLLHSVWLYNRTFHRALDMCPYEAYTKQTPTVDGLLTFGCRIVAKKSKTRSNATNPNAYDGIFLGYRATMDNIIYWDIQSQQKRTARHYEFDEIHYGTDPEKRNPAARHLIEVHTGTPHTERRTDVLLEPSTDVEQTTNPTSWILTPKLSKILHSHTRL